MKRMRTRPPLSIDVRLTGGLGDVLMASPFLESLYDALDGVARFTLYYHTPSVTEFVFARAPFIDVNMQGTHDDLKRKQVRDQADMLVHTGHFPRYIVQNATGLRHAPTSFGRILADAAERARENEGLILAHPRLDGFWARHVARERWSYLDGIGHMSGLADVTAKRFAFLALDPGQRCTTGIPRDRPIITLHDGFDTRQPVPSGEATKQWPIKYWQQLVALIRERYPHVRTVQLGGSKSRAIPGVEHNLIERTTLTQAAWLIKDAALHIDTDSGLAHLARMLHTRAIVLFGPTNAAYFGHDENENLSATRCGDCWWSTPTWLGKCPRGLPIPECMTSIKPEAVWHVFLDHIGAYGDRNFVALEALPLRLYDGPDERFALIPNALDLPSLPITEHIIDAATGVYVHASKQWEYCYVIETMHAILEPAPNASLRIADVGGGRGALASYLGSIGHRVDQFDLDYQWDGTPDLERRYRAHVRERNVAARFGSIYNVPVADNTYDVGCCISVIEHVPEKDAVLQELLRIVKPGGIVVLTFDFALQPEKFRDARRVEVTGPAQLGQLLYRQQIKTPLFPSPEQIVASGAAMQRDGVRGIPDGMTVAGLTIRKTAVTA